MSFFNRSRTCCRLFGLTRNTMNPPPPAAKSLPRSPRLSDWSPTPLQQPAHRVSRSSSSTVGSSWVVQRQVYLDTDIVGVNMYLLDRDAFCPRITEDLARRVGTLA